MSIIKSYLPRSLSWRKHHKCLFQGHNRVVQVNFKPQPCQSVSHIAANHLTTLLRLIEKITRPIMLLWYKSYRMFIFLWIKDTEQICKNLKASKIWQAKRKWNGAEIDKFVPYMICFPHFHLHVSIQVYMQLPPPCDTLYISFTLQVSLKLLNCVP